MMFEITSAGSPENVSRALRLLADMIDSGKVTVTEVEMQNHTEALPWDHPRQLESAWPIRRVTGTTLKVDFIPEDAGVPV